MPSLDYFWYQHRAHTETSKERGLHPRWRITAPPVTAFTVSGSALIVSLKTRQMSPFLLPLSTTPAMSLFGFEAAPMAAVLKSDKLGVGVEDDPKFKAPPYNAAFEGTVVSSRKKAQNRN